MLYECVRVCDLPHTVLQVSSFNGPLLTANKLEDKWPSSRLLFIPHQENLPQ